MRRRFQHGLLRAIAELRFGAQTVRNIAIVQAWLEENNEASSSELFGKFQEWAAPKTLVDGSRIYCIDSACLPCLQTAFPKARYLHLRRHPKSTLDSLQEVLPRLNFNAERLWLKPYLEIMEFLEGVSPERQVRLRVEHLLAAPDLYLKQIAEWLKVSTDSQSIDAMKHPQHSPFACYGPANASFGIDRDFLENPVLGANQTSPGQWEHQFVRDTDLADETKQYMSLFGYTGRE
jgi:hypothetical protein